MELAIKEPLEALSNATGRPKPSNRRTRASRAYRGRATGPRQVQAAETSGAGH